MHWSSWLLMNCVRDSRPKFRANRVRYFHANEAGETQSAQVHPMLRMTATIYLALAALCSACVEGWSMTQPMHGQFPSEDWPYWHLIVFTLSVVLFGVAVGLIHVRRRWWIVTAAFSPLVIAGGLLLSSSRSLILGYVVLSAVVFALVTIGAVRSSRQTIVAFAIILLLALWWIPTLVRWVPAPPYIDERPARV